MGRSLFLAAILGLAAGQGIYSDLPRSKFRDREPKNKYGLTPKQVEALEHMTPKEKKKFLKTIREGNHVEEGQASTGRSVVRGKEEGKAFEEQIQSEPGTNNCNENNDSDTEENILEKRN